MYPAIPITLAPESKPINGIETAEAAAPVSIGFFLTSACLTFVPTSTTSSIFSLTILVSIVGSPERTPLIKLKVFVVLFLPSSPFTLIFRSPRGRFGSFSSIVSNGISSSVTSSDVDLFGSIVSTAFTTDLFDTSTLPKIF